MKNKKIKLLIILLGIICFDFLFWRQKLGLNILIFTAISYIYLFLNKKLKELSLSTYITAAGTLIAAIFVVLNNSFTSLFAYIVSFIIFIGFYYQKSIKSISASISTGVANFFMAQQKFFKNISSGINVLRFNKIWRFIKFTIIPLIVLTVFFFIFKLANPVFNRLSNEFFYEINIFLLRVFENLNWAKILFLVFALFLIVGIAYDGNVISFLYIDKNNKDTILRKRRQRKSYANFNLVALKNENKIAGILVSMVNLLLLIVNIIDILWIWFGYEYTNSGKSSKMVHEGTYLLIFSILLSMFILMYFFRKNQNFYKKNLFLKIVSFIWIFQNAILLLSVAIRNFHYINYCGLAYKRIGVFIFLLLTIIGLIFMLLKIKGGKSSYYLVKKNSWVVYFMMIFLTFFNWDVLIAEYNLTIDYKSKTDIQFLMKLTDKALYVLDKNNDKISKEYHLDSWDSYMDKRIAILKAEESEKSWKSWNYADYNSYQYFVRKEVGF